MGGRNRCVFKICPHDRVSSRYSKSVGSKRKRIVLNGDKATLRQASTCFVFISLPQLCLLQKARRRTKRAKKSVSSAESSGPTIDLTEIDDDDIEERETSGRKGPKNNSRLHYHEPKAVKHKGEKRWEFKCHHCSRNVHSSRGVCNLC